MSLAGNGNVMRLVADVYLTAGKKKKALRDVRLRNTLFPEVQRRDLDKAVILAANAKVNWSRIFLKKAAIYLLLGLNMVRKKCLLVLRYKLQRCIQPTNIS